MNIPVHEVLDRDKTEERYCGICVHYRPIDEHSGDCQVPYIISHYGARVDRLWCSDFFYKAKGKALARLEPGGQTSAGSV